MIQREKFNAINVNEKTEKKYDEAKKSTTLHEFLKKIKEKIIERKCVIIICDMFNQSLDITSFLDARNVLTKFEKKIDDDFLRLTLKSFSKTNSLKKRKIKSFRLIIRVSRMLALSFSQSLSINLIVIIDEQNFISISSFQSELSQIKSIVKIFSKKNKVSSFDFVKTSRYKREQNRKIVELHRTLATLKTKLDASTQSESFKRKHQKKNDDQSNAQINKRRKKNTQKIDITLKTLDSHDAKKQSSHSQKNFHDALKEIDDVSNSSLERLIRDFIAFSIESFTKNEIHHQLDLIADQTVDEQNIQSESQNFLFDDSSSSSSESSEFEKK
ncbi:hypothetical protein FQN54_001364 [Arachnomyces sp. PD_36]|nr:hypothetical protein FQN54_001364 [Arachnomyces sp. PD_36]